MEVLLTCFTNSYNETGDLQNQQLYDYPVLQLRYQRPTSSAYIHTYMHEVDTKSRCET